MKIFYPIITFLILTACSQQVVYDALHERERQLCLKQALTDCSRSESYEKYKKQREEVIQYDNLGNVE